MNFIDIIILSAVCLCVLICTLKGFIKIILKSAAFVASVFISMTLAGPLRNLLFSSVDPVSPTNPMFDEISILIASTVLFVVSMLILGIAASVLTRIAVRGLAAKNIDKFLGFLTGIVLSAAIIFVFVKALDTVAMFAFYFSPSLDVYAAMDESYILSRLLNF